MRQAHRRQASLAWVFIACALFTALPTRSADAPADTTSCVASSGRRPEAGCLRNPIVDAIDGWAAADPSIVLHDGYYHWVRSLKTPGIGIARAKRLQDLGRVPMTVVYRPEGGGADAHHLWAPELVRVQGRWLIYYAADDGPNEHHRMFVLSADGDDPLGTWTAHGRLATADDFWAIDGTVLQRSDGRLFFLWSGWEADRDDHRQHLYIAAMRDPFTLDGHRVRLSSPDLPWEASALGPDTVRIEEAPQPIEHDGRLSVVYSAAGSWSPDYVLGLLIHTGGDVLDPATWIKRPLPVFCANAEGRTWGVGHPTFTTSPDGREDWVVYHGMPDPAAGWRGRSLYAQPFGWNADGTPDFGVPDAHGAVRAEPSGSAATSTSSPTTRSRVRPEFTAMPSSCAR